MTIAQLVDTLKAFVGRWDTPVIIKQGEQELQLVGLEMDRSQMLHDGSYEDLPIIVIKVQETP